MRCEKRAHLRAAGLFAFCLFALCACLDDNTNYCAVPSRSVTLIINPPSQAPAGVNAWRVVFFPADTTQVPIAFDVRDSLSVRLPDGLYRAFVYNNNSEINRFKANDESVAGAPMLCTDPCDPRGTWSDEAHADETFYDYPDHAFACYTQVQVSGGRVVLAPVPVTAPLRVVVTGLENLQRATGVRLVVDGIEPAYAPADTAQRADIRVIADARIDASAGTLSADLQTFGLRSGPHTVTLFIEGANFQKRLDFEVPSVSEGTTTLTVAAGIDLNDFVPAESGLNISAENWEDKEIDIAL